jgi:hypothetical protein
MATLPAIPFGAPFQPPLVLWFLLGTLVLVKLLLGWLNSATGKGFLGERAVRHGLGSTLDPAVYRSLHDLLIHTGTGTTTQLDHVILSPFGIFVIETKNFSGWIFGTARDRYWTVSYRGRRNHRMLNPILQNAGHIKAVESVLSLPPDSGFCHNIVFLVGDAQLKTGPIAGVFHRGIADYIRSFKECVFDSDEVVEIERRLQAASLSGDRQARAAHIAHVKSRQKG